MMVECFRGWRRKAGLVTLLLACVFAAGWVRSRTGIIDEIVLRGDDHTLYFLRSGGNWVQWYVRYDPQYSFPKNIRIWQTFNCDWKSYTPYDGLDKVWDGNKVSVANPHLILPYYVVVIPLTLISAWLLLSKQPKPKAHPTRSEPTLEIANRR